MGVNNCSLLTSGSSHQSFCFPEVQREKARACFGPEKVVTWPSVSAGVEQGASTSHRLPASVRVKGWTSVTKDHVVALTHPTYRCSLFLMLRLPFMRAVADE